MEWRDEILFIVPYRRTRDLGGAKPSLFRELPSGREMEVNCYFQVLSVELIRGVNKLRSMNVLN